jgi:hypothetical protein
MIKYKVVGPRREVWVSNVESKKRADRYARDFARGTGRKFSVKSYKAPARTVVRVIH